jgi:photosystem II stability/assembly factor-like uncharacterized protein
LISLLLTLCTISSLFGQWIRTRGPEGGTITSLYADSQNTFAGSGDGDIFYSSDFSSNWELRKYGLPLNRSINCIIKRDNIFYAGTEGVYFSSNSGISWTGMNFNANVLSIAFSGNMLIAGIYYGGVYTTTNNGQNWIHSTNGLPSIAYVYAMLASDSTILISAGGGIYASTDNCESWFNSSTGLPTTQVESFVKKGNKIFAGTSMYGIYASTDNGSNWFYSGQGLPEYAQVYSMVLADNDIIASVYETGILKSTDNGLSWHPINLGLHNYINVVSLALYGNIYLAGTWNEGILKSTNSGNYWNYSNTGISGTTVISLFTNNGKIYCGTSMNGVHFTADGGTSWLQLSSYNTLIRQVAAVTESGPNILAGTTGQNGGIFLTSNNGLNWQLVFEDTSTLAENINSFAIIGNNTFAATNLGLIKSTDDGYTWEFVNTVYPNSNVNVLYVHGNDLYAACYGLYRSTDAGLSWTSLGLASYEIYSIAVSGNTIFAGTFGMGVLRSSNSGFSWLTSFIGSGYIINAICVYQNYIFCSAGGIIYYSSNNGQNWIESYSFLTGEFSPYKLCELNGNLYTGSSHFGLWKRSIQEIIGIKEIPASIPDKFSLYQNYPNPFNPTTKIKFSIPLSRGVPGRGVLTRLVIYDVLGKEVATLVNKQLNPGTYEVEWDGTNYPSGVYFYKLIAADYTETRKMVLLK